MTESSDLERFVDKNEAPWVVFCFLSITVRAPAVIYVQAFVQVTPGLAVSCLFVFPIDVLKS